MVKTNYSGSTDLLTSGCLFMYSVSRPKKDGLMLLTWFSDLQFDLKIRCKVLRRLWRRVAVSSVDHPCIDVCFYINRRFFSIATSKFWLRLNCSYFFLAIIVLNRS